MDKYRRDDDTNDDLGVYNQKDDYNGFDTIYKSKTPNQFLRDTESDDIVKECERNNKKTLNKLSLKEKELWKRVIKGQSLRRAARLMGISQPMVSKYWKQIKEKMA